jgi:hypothetical protein
MIDETCEISPKSVFFLWMMAEQVRDTPDNKLLIQIRSTLLCSALLEWPDFHSA